MTHRPDRIEEPRPEWTAYRDALAALMRHRTERPDDTANRISLLDAAIETRRGLDDREIEDAYASAETNPWRETR